MVHWNLYLEKVCLFKYVLYYCSKIVIHLFYDNFNPEPDIAIWNDFISGLPPNERSFFKTCWLYAECYMYRKIYSIFEASSTLKTYDYFGAQKLNALEVSSDIMDRIICNINMTTKDEGIFTHILKVDNDISRINTCSKLHLNIRSSIFGEIVVICRLLPDKN